MGSTVAINTSAQDSRFFEWQDADKDSPRQLAKKFVTRFRRVTPFLKEFVKCKRFPSGLVHTGSAVRNRLFSELLVNCVV